ncbi:MAG: hypothetical protein ABIQ15_07040 [Nocardioides sp.]
MLLLDARSALIDGISVFPDHHDPEQWYYLPSAPHLTMVKDGSGRDVPSFLLLALISENNPGGLLSFDCNIGLTQGQIDSLAQKIGNAEGLANTPRLAPVPLVDGTVRLIILGTQTGAPEGEPPTDSPFVESAIHYAKPSLYGENQAAFSVMLTRDGYAVVRGTLDATIMPVAVVYSLDFLGLRPAYSITLKVDWDRVQKHLDESFSAKVLVFSTEISKAVDELVESKAITLTSDTFVTEDTEGVIDRRDAALAQVRAMITDAFFQSSLPPWTPDKPADWEKALRLGSELATQHAQAGATGGATSSMSFGYKRTDVTRIDKKRLDIDFSERTTVRRTINPQGHLASLVSSISESPGLLEMLVRDIPVDLDKFERRKLSAVYQPALGADSIGSINVRASYDGVPKNQILTEAPWQADFDWQSKVVDGRMVRDVDVSYEVHFKDAETTERPGSLASGVEPTTDDMVQLTPEDELFAIRSVSLVAENVPWDRFPSVEVHLRHRDEANGIDEQHLVKLTKEKVDSVWPMFVVDRANTAYEVRTVMRATDNNDVDSGWLTTDDEQITVRNPFRARILEVVPNLSWAEVQDVFIDVRYEDPDNNILIEDSLHLNEGAVTPRFIVDLRDPNRTAIEFTVTFTFKDGTSKQLPPSITHDRRIMVSPAMRAHRVVEILPPSDWVARSVRNITVETRFEDFVENLTFGGHFDLDAPGAKARFEFDYADEARNRYEYRYTVVFANGLTRNVDWTASDQARLILALS